MQEDCTTTSLRPQAQERIFVNENDKIKDLELQAHNTRHLVERLTRAAYGMTFPELIKALGNREEEKHNAESVSDR